MPLCNEKWSQQTQHGHGKRHHLSQLRDVARKRRVPKQLAHQSVWLRYTHALEEGIVGENLHVSRNQVTCKQKSTWSFSWTEIKQCFAYNKCTDHGKFNTGTVSLFIKPYAARQTICL